MSPFLLPSLFSLLQVSISLHIACFRLSTFFFSLCVFEHLFCLLVLPLLSLCICLCQLGFIYICHHLFFCVSILVSSRFLSQRMSFVPSPFIVNYTLMCLLSFLSFSISCCSFRDVCFCVSQGCLLHICLSAC